MITDWDKTFAIKCRRTDKNSREKLPSVKGELAIKQRENVFAKHTTNRQSQPSERT